MSSKSDSQSLSLASPTKSLPYESWESLSLDFPALYFHPEQKTVWCDASRGMPDVFRTKIKTYLSLQYTNTGDK